MGRGAPHEEDDMTTTPTPVTTVPSRVVEHPDRAWTIYEFANPTDAADFVAAHPECAMPCWQRFETINGALMQVR